MNVPHTLSCPRRRFVGVTVICRAGCARVRHVRLFAIARCSGQPRSKTRRRLAMAGLATNMWGVVVDRTGTVCAVAFTGDNVGDQWPGSRLSRGGQRRTPPMHSALMGRRCRPPIFTRARSRAASCSAFKPIIRSISRPRTRARQAIYGTAKDPLVGGGRRRVRRCSAADSRSTTSRVKSPAA